MIQPSITVVARPPSASTVRIDGESGSREKTQHFAGEPRRIANVRGSSPFTTHQPRDRVILVITAFTSASWSIVSMPPSPRWSAVMFVTTDTSLYKTPTPRRRMPPRAVSVTASCSPRRLRIFAAPPGPE